MGTIGGQVDLAVLALGVLLLTGAAAMWLTRSRRAETLARELAAARAAVETLRADLAASRAEHDRDRSTAEQAVADLRQRISELEAQNTKHEDRILKAYQKIRNDEAVREKTRKAVALALQLREERATSPLPPEVQPPRD